MRADSGSLHYRDGRRLTRAEQGNEHSRCAFVIHRHPFDLATAVAGCDHRGMPRFLTLADVAEILNVSAAQAYALVRSGELPAIQVGGRGQWRIEEQRLEDYITAKYAETEARVEFMQRHIEGALAP